LSPKFSVVIPTYNRLDVLPEVLSALENQQGAPPFEVLVIDDGSSDGTDAFLKERQLSLPFKVFTQANQGPATARNRGVTEAAGERVAFLGDDTVPSPGWLAAHQRAASQRAAKHGESEALAVIGYTAWHSRMRLNPFLRYINEYGLQFGYALIEDPEDVPFNFLYTSNLSLPRQLLVEEPFDLGFPYAAWEDIELAYRLQKRGLRLVYEPQARVEHDHPTTIQRFTERQEKAGYSAVVFYLLHQELGEFLGVGPEGPPPLPPRRQHQLREGFVRMVEGLPVHVPKLWDETLRYHYIRGLQRGWGDREKLS
jgi:glycosyltransferase involved in cell wall biosynthesis